MEAGTLPVHESGPLSGIRVVDFTWWVVGPWAPRMMADLGAEVVHIERVDAFDGTRGNTGLERRPRKGKPNIPGSPNQSGGFNTLHANKIGATLNMRHPEGLKLAELLIAKSDCIVENFSSGVMESWGLGWERMRELNPAPGLRVDVGLGTQWDVEELPELRSNGSGDQRLNALFRPPRTGIGGLWLLLHGCPRWVFRFTRFGLRPSTMRSAPARAASLTTALLRGQ